MRKLLAAALLTLSLAAIPTPGAQHYATTCAAPTEDSIVTCNLLPYGRYTYDRGTWTLVPDSYRYANGHRPPVGADVMRINPDA